MNAKITLTVPMDKIPQEVHRILNQISKELAGLSEDTKNITCLHDSVKLLSHIEKYRSVLTLLDANYDDCYSVLVGYLKFQTETRMRESKQSTETIGDKQSNG